MLLLLRAVPRGTSRHARALATTTIPSTPPSHSKFSEELGKGPGLDDFIAGDVPEHVILGNTKAYGDFSTLKISSQ